jgi:hypothetical protein
MISRLWASLLYSTVKIVSESGSNLANKFSLSREKRNSSMHHPSKAKVRDKTSKQILRRNTRWGAKEQRAGVTTHAYRYFIRLSLTFNRTSQV